MSKNEYIVIQDSKTGNWGICKAYFLPLDYPFENKEKALAAVSDCARMEKVFCFSK